MRSRRIATVEPRVVKVVECRFFGGLSGEGNRRRTRLDASNGAARLGEGACAVACARSSRDRLVIIAREGWRSLASLVDTLLDAPPDQRARLIAGMSGDDMRRRAELEELLAECERDAPLLSRPAAEAFGALFDDDAAPFPTRSRIAIGLSGSSAVAEWRRCTSPRT